MKKSIYSFIFFFSILINGCTWFNIYDVKIIEYAPNTPTVDASTDPQIWVEFSKEVNKTKAELALTLYESGGKLEGKFEWEGNKVYFIPYKKISRGHDYQLQVKRSVEDDFGNSLDVEFLKFFTTKISKEVPKIIFFSPEDKTITDDLYQPIIIEFSKEINPESFYESFSIQPETIGVYTWENSKKVSFTPVYSLEKKAEYTIQVSTEIIDFDHNFLPSIESRTFTVGTDTTPPQILQVSNSLQTIILSPIPENSNEYTFQSGWEKEDSIQISFSETIETRSFESSIEISPSISFEYIWDNEKKNLSLLPEDPFKYNEVYNLSLEGKWKDINNNQQTTELQYRFKINGIFSIPPEIKRITFLSDPTPPIPPVSIIELTDYATVTATMQNYTIKNKGFFDVAVKTYNNANLKFRSLLDCFSISTTNGCSSFSSKSIEIAPASPPPLFPAIEGEIIIRFYFEITDYSDSNGIIQIQINNKLEDTNGNFLKEIFQLYLFD